MADEENDIVPVTDELLLTEEGGEGDGTEQEATAAPAEETPVEPTEGAKTFTQEEVDAIVAKRLLREQRRQEREQTAPRPDSFDDDGNPLSREQIIAQYEAERRQQAVNEQFDEREEIALEKYDDFQQVAYNPALKVTDQMALAIRSAEGGPDVLYWLGSNPKESARIARLDPVSQVREIGKIEAELAANPPAKRTTAAPAPITPVTPRTTGKVYDTTDPRSIEAMSTSDWINAERARQAKAARN